MLNRCIEWKDGEGVVLTVDPRHVQVMIEKLECGRKTALKVPIEKAKAEDNHDKELDLAMRKQKGTLGSKNAGRDGEEALGPEETTLYRAVAARANYLSSDRAGISFAVKEACMRMSAPTKSDMHPLERTARYLKSVPVVKQWFRLQPWQGKWVSYTDTDWAGCVRTRRSTTGGCIVHGWHVIRASFKTQALIALSSGEAELYGAIRASSEFVGMMSAIEDLNYDGMVGEVLGDASAALGVIKRKGTGRLRHLNTSWLWIQDMAAQKHLEYSKVNGNDNIADLFTKALTQDVIRKHMKNMDHEIVEATSEGEMDMSKDNAVAFLGPRPEKIDVEGLLGSLGIVDRRL